MAQHQTPLSRERVLRTAMAYADESGIQTLSMRGLAADLGVAPMSLYRHVANREDLLDSLVDLVFTEIDLEPSGDDWKAALRQRAISARDALLSHRWAIGVLESRSHPGPANLRHHDAMLGTLRAAGFSSPMAAHAYSVLDSYIHGFALRLANLPSVPDKEGETAGEVMPTPPAEEYPNLLAMMTEHPMRPGYDPGQEFEYGLDLIVDALERVRDSPSAGNG
jgi:AcrR family transcriptional regulator